MGENRDAGEEDQLRGNGPGWQRGPSRATHDMVEAEHRRRENEREDEERGDPVGPPAAEAQVRRRAVEEGENIDVGEIGADEQGGGSPGSAPGEAASRQRGADQRVTDRIYAALIRRGAA